MLVAPDPFLGDSAILAFCWTGSARGLTLFDSPATIFRRQVQLFLPFGLLSGYRASSAGGRSSANFFLCGGSQVLISSNKEHMCLLLAFSSARFAPGPGEFVAGCTAFCPSIILFFPLLRAGVRSRQVLTPALT